MNVAKMEEKLSLILKENKNSQDLVNGINVKEAEKILEWVVQNAREGLEKASDEPIMDDSLLGGCGFGQGVTGFTLINMGLSPNILNANPTLNSNGGRHGFLSVGIPIKNDDGTIEEKLYLVDTTYRQFFLRDEISNNGGFVKDKKYGNKVAALEGYWVLQMENGKEFAEEILSKGFIELTEENAKIYGDSFTLATKERKNNTKVPTKKELVTGISGEQYLRNMTNPQFHEEIDYDEKEMEDWEINIKTPLMQKREISNSKSYFKENENVQTKQNEIDDKEV